MNKLNTRLKTYWEIIIFSGLCLSSVFILFFAYFIHINTIKVYYPPGPPPKLKSEVKLTFLDPDNVHIENVTLGEPVLPKIHEHIGCKCLQTELEAEIKRKALEAERKQKALEEQKKLADKNPPVRHRISYRGYYKSTNDTILACVITESLQRNKTIASDTNYLKSGDSTFASQIVSFGEDELILKGKSGKIHTVKKGQSLYID
ncbi:MAG: hypothetical protein HRT89_17990 [Lentisphaeria bacterium]|nr:hypothetical protein [Lentisphaeria bacterium]NQZ69948.1 hypothetical protein [Lentisphaeria bacterium]